MLGGEILHRYKFPWQEEYSVGLTSATLLFLHQRNLKFQLFIIES